MSELMPRYGNPPKAPAKKQEAYPFISEDEFYKVIDALREKYSISKCDGLPYIPKVTKIILSGKIQ